MGLLQVGLSTAAVAPLRALLAAVVCWRAPGRPALAYGLWLLVLLKLITPPLVPVALPALAPPSEHSLSEPDQPTEPTCPVMAPAEPVPDPSDEAPPVLTEEAPTPVPGCDLYHVLTPARAP